MQAKLSVQRDEFVRALRPVGRVVRPRAAGQAVLSFEDGMLEVALPGVAARMPAEGIWPGQARVAGRFILMLAQMPPEEDPVVIGAENGQLRIGSSRMACVWQEDTGSRISLPINAPFAMILSVAYHYTPDDIQRAGLKRRVADAEEKRDALIGQATAALSDFGVTRAELRAIVDGKMRATPRP